MSEELDIYLGDTLVGTLRSHDERNEFRLGSAYKAMYPQPVLGQAFVDDPDRVHTSTVKLPPFFANLLPEGKLREIVARHIGVKEVREFYLLAHLGEDLPGAVRAVARGDVVAGSDAVSSDEQSASDVWKFSLAGVQLKLSMLLSQGKLTLPMRGQHGDWIVKFPDPLFPRVPENESSMLTWAREAGIAVPEHRLVRRDEIEGLPEDFDPGEQRSFAIRRFDRPASGGRVHQEDFAQVFGLYPDAKYDAHNYESVGSAVLRVAGSEDFERFLDQLAFVILSGNGDAHHKNWSLQYPDGVHARLAPAYDQVATILYQEQLKLLTHSKKREETLALNLAGSRRFQDVSTDSFRRMAHKLSENMAQVGYDPGRVVPRVKAAVERVREAWTRVREDLPLAKDEIRTIELHMDRIPLVTGPRGGFRPPHRSTRRSR